MHKPYIIDKVSEMHLILLPYCILLLDKSSTQDLIAQEIVSDILPLESKRIIDNSGNCQLKSVTSKHNVFCTVLHMLICSIL